MDDRELLAALEGLGLSREHHRAALLLPLIEVAWADGRIQRAERRRLLAIAKRHQISMPDGWLDRWLGRRPSKKAFLAAHTALLALMSRHDPDASQPRMAIDLRSTALLRLCEEVAASAGGLFGFAFSISASERDCIEQIAQSLALGPALPEGVVSAWNDARDRRQKAEAPTRMRPPRRTGPRYGILDQTTVHTPPPSPFSASGSTDVTDSDTPRQDRTDPFDAWLDRTGRRKGAEPRPASREVPRPDATPAPKPVAQPPVARTASARTPAPAPKSESPSPIRVHVGPPVPPPPPPPPPPNVRTVVARPPKRRERSPEDDPTLPFFDSVNVGTYALDPSRRDDEP